MDMTKQAHTHMHTNGAIAARMKMCLSEASGHISENVGLCVNPVHQQHRLTHSWHTASTWTQVHTCTFIRVCVCLLECVHESSEDLVKIRNPAPPNSAPPTLVNCTNRSRADPGVGVTPSDHPQ